MSGLLPTRPRPLSPESSGCRLHRWTSPNTSRPWWGSRSFHGAADGVRPGPRVTSGGQKAGCPNRGLHVWTTGESGGPVPRKAVRSRGPQVWSESGVFRLVRDLVGGALPAVPEAVAVAEHGPGCNNRPVWAVLSPHTTGRFLLTIIATASGTGAFDYGHAPRIR